MPRVVVVSRDLRLRSHLSELLRPVLGDDLGTAQGVKGLLRRFSGRGVELLLSVDRALEVVPAAMAPCALVELPALPEQGGVGRDWQEQVLELVCSRLGVEPPALQPAPLPLPALARARGGPVDILAIASSTGGPDALARVFSDLPGPLGIPVVIVQHMPAEFTALLAERLDRLCAMQVREGHDGARVEPDTVWVAPGGHHMVLERRRTDLVLRLNDDPPVHSCRPAADPMLFSVAELFGARALGTVLTGMGCDGLEGSRRLVEAGCDVIAQDEESSVVWGMPGFVARAGLASAVLPLSEIGAAIGQRVLASRPKGGRRAG